MSDGGARDVGAAVERTRLSWRRTGLSAAAVALLGLRPAFRPHPGVESILIAAAAMAAWAALVALAYIRNRGLRSLPPGPAAPAIVLSTVIVVGIALIGGLVVTL